MVLDWVKWEQNRDLVKFKIPLALFQSGKVKRHVRAWGRKAQEDTHLS